MRGVWSKSRPCYPNWGYFFSPFLPGLPLKASSPYPLNWFCFTRRGNNEIVDLEVFNCPLSRRSPDLSPSQKACSYGHFIYPSRERYKKQNFSFELTLERCEYLTGLRSRRRFRCICCRIDTEMVNEARNRLQCCLGPNQNKLLNAI